MTDYRALCAELLQGLDENRHGEVRYPGHLRIIMDRARTALAQPEPPAEGEVGEVVDQIRQIALAWEPDACLLGNMTAGQLARAANLLRHGQSALHRLHRLQQENARFREPERTILCDLLANGTLLPDPDGKRYGVPPAEGDVGDEVLPPRVGHILRLAEIIRAVDGNHDKGAAALAEAILSHPGICSAGLAAELLQHRQPPPPVAGAGGGPAAEDCDAEGRCWWFYRAAVPEWQLASDGPYGDAWLPAHALPLPAGEVQP